ncbi:MAG: hypothetical protein K8J09_21735 [Planctomycetes bacterium]|nr:hypothetical protein [Planctomycetota bacterium]MCC7399524.1 hypothetical protein [Planctomycetota bacterium]
MVGRRLLLDLPVWLLVGGVVSLGWYLHGLLDVAATADGPAAGPGLWFAVAAFLVTVVAVVLAQGLRMAERVAGPEHRLRAALQRIRSGDVGFRVTLRRGDPLQELARECNALLDWLNHNPPAGARTGTDIVEVGAEELEEVAP